MRVVIGGGIPTLRAFAHNASRGVGPYGDGVSATIPDLPPVARADVPRAWHYGEFYGLKPLPDNGAPFLVVHGNCQAESIRLLLQGADDAPCASVRIPAVHELTPDEVPFLRRLLERAAVVLTQPVTDGYHGLPLGSGEVAATAASAQVVLWPVIRYAGLLPWQVVFTHPREGDPPIVPYHDIRTMLRAAGEPPVDPTGASFRAVSRWSVDELRARENRAGSVPVSRLLLDAGARATNTINHPGNPVLVGLARQTQERLGWPATAADPGFELLDSIHAPRDDRVLEALGLAPDDVAPEDGTWLVGGSPVPDADVVDAQLSWYRQHPDVLSEALTRSAEQRRLLQTSSR